MRSAPGARSGRCPGERGAGRGSSRRPRRAAGRGPPASTGMDRSPHAGQAAPGAREESIRNARRMRRQRSGRRLCHAASLCTVHMRGTALPQAKLPDFENDRGSAGGRAGRSRLAPCCVPGSLDNFRRCGGGAWGSRRRTAGRPTLWPISGHAAAGAWPAPRAH